MCAIFDVVRFCNFSTFLSHFYAIDSIYEHGSTECLKLTCSYFLHLMSASTLAWSQCLAFGTMVWLLQWHQPMVWWLMTQLLRSMLVSHEVLLHGFPSPSPCKFLLLWERVVAICGSRRLHRNDVQTTNVEESRWRSCTCNSRQRSCTWNVNWPFMFWLSCKLILDTL